MYNYQYFKNSIPGWKRKKDPLIAQYIYRPLSFFVSAICANAGINANSVSYFSAVIALISCVLIAINNNIANIIGAILINIWLVLDCVDGNLARAVKKMPFGEFADGVSSYLLVAFLGISLGVNAYYNGGCIVSETNILCVVCGAFISIFDSLTRLIFQKYKVEEQKIIMGSAEYKIDDGGKKDPSVIVRIQEAMGIGGWLPALILFGIIFNFTDIILLYCFLFYGSFFLAGNARTILHVLKETNAQMNAEIRRK